MRYRLDLGSKYDLADLARKRSEHATATLANQGNYEPGYVRVMVKLRSFIVNITNFSQTTEDYKTAARYQITIMPVQSGSASGTPEGYKICKFRSIPFIRTRI